METELVGEFEGAKLGETGFSGPSAAFPAFPGGKIDPPNFLGLRLEWDGDYGVERRDRGSEDDELVYYTFC